MKYVFLGDDNQFPVIVSADLTQVEEGKLLRVFEGTQVGVGLDLQQYKGHKPNNLHA